MAALTQIIASRYGITNQTNVYNKLYTAGMLVFVQSESSSLEALAVHNGWAALVVLLLGDPHLLEGGEGGQDGATDPYRVLPLRRSNDLDLNGGWGKSGDLLL